MTQQARDLATRAKLQAALRLGPGGDDTSVANLACEMLAELVLQTEAALGGRVRTVAFDVEGREDLGGMAAREAKYQRDNDWEFRR